MAVRFLRLSASAALLGGASGQAISTCTAGPDGLCTTGEGAAVMPAFAETALWVEALIPDKCDYSSNFGQRCNWGAVTDDWRYVFSNLRLAIQYASTAHAASITAETVKIVHDINELLYQKGNDPKFWTQQWAPSAQAARAVIEKLRSWLKGYQWGPPLRVTRANIASIYPGLAGKSATVPTDSAATVTLSNGVKMPVLGFSTSQIPADGRCRQAVKWALEAGYRHIETAQSFGNEIEVGSAIKASGLPRSEVTVMTMLSKPKEYKSARETVMRQLHILGVDYIDFYTISGGYDVSYLGEGLFKTAWQQLEQLVDEGVIKALGVNNLNIAQLEDLFTYARVKPVWMIKSLSIYQPANQADANEAVSLMAWAKTNNLVVVGDGVNGAYPNVGSEDPHVKAIAARLGRTPEQVLHRWELQLGVQAILAGHDLESQQSIVENSQLFDFVIPESDMRLLNGIPALMHSWSGNPLWLEDVYGVSAWEGNTEL